MTARFLMVVFDSAYLIALAAWVGGVLFFAFGVAPLIFPILGAEAGGRLVRTLLPRSYTWGAIAGAVALPAMVAVPLCYPELRGPRVGIEALVIIAGILLMLYAGNSLTPAINAARDAGAGGMGQYERLLRRTVLLNRVVLLLGVVLLISYAARPVPQSGGIVELSPQERAQRINAARQNRATPSPEPVPRSAR